jgi:hypothetical protein
MDEQGFLSEQEIEQNEEERRELKGELPSHELIREHFTKPMEAELDRFKDDTPDWRRGTEPKYVPPEPEESYTPQEEVPPVYTPPPQGYEPSAFYGDNLEDYTHYVLSEAKKSFEHSYNERRLDERVESTEIAARQAHTGDDHLPDYDSVVDSHVVPMIRQRPEVFSWLRAQPNPAEAAFLVGCLLRFPHLQNVLKTQGENAFYRAIRGGSAPTVRARGGRLRPAGKLTAAQIEAMPNSDFEKILDDWKLYGE